MTHLNVLHSKDVYELERSMRVILMCACALYVIVLGGWAVCVGMARLILVYACINGQSD